MKSASRGRNIKWLGRILAFALAICGLSLPVGLGVAVTGIAWGLWPLVGVGLLLVVLGLAGSWILWTAFGEQDW